MPAAAIPWKLLIQALPHVVGGARKVWDHWSSRPKPISVDPKSDVKTQLEAITERLAALESAETEQARIISQMGEQLEGIARRVSIAYWLGFAGLTVACIALVVAAFR